MKVHKLIGFIIFALMSVSGYAQCNFETFLKTYFDVYDANDSLVELGEDITKGLHKKQIDREEEFSDCALYFPSQGIPYYSCHINNYYVLMFWTVHSVDNDYDLDDDVLVLCNEKGEIMDRYIHRKVVRTYMASYRYYLQKDTLIWRYWDENDSSGAYTEQLFKIIKDKIVPLL